MSHSAFYNEGAAIALNEGKNANNKIKSKDKNARKNGNKLGTIEKKIVGSVSDGKGSKMNAPQHPYIKPNVTSDDTLRQKHLYAIGLLREGDPLKAAYLIFPNDPQKAIWAGKEWPNDPIVLVERERLIAEHGEDFFLPNEIEFARNVWQRAQRAVMDDDYAKLMKLYADSRGFIKKDTNQNQINIISPKVMLLNQQVENQTDDEWAMSVREKQRALTSDNRPSN